MFKIRPIGPCESTNILRVIYHDYRTGTQCLHAHDSQRTETEEDTKEKELEREEHDTETNQSVIKDLILRLFYKIYYYVQSL
jgi:hypothetical protein